MLRMPMKPVGNTLGTNWEHQNPKSRTPHLLPPLSCPPLTSPHPLWPPNEERWPFLGASRTSHRAA